MIWRLFAEKEMFLPPLPDISSPLFFSAPISGWRLQVIEVGGGGEGHFLHLARNCFDLCEGEGRGGKKVVGLENQRSSDFKKWFLFVRVYVGRYCTWFHSSRIRCDPWSHNSEVHCAQVLVTRKRSFCPPSFLPFFGSRFGE